MEMNKTLASSGGRITVIDALRGFSLIGICLIHAMQHFGAMGTMAPQAMFPWEGTLDEIFRWFINYLVFGKFFIIFSCLFGLSFFIHSSVESRVQKTVERHGVTVEEAKNMMEKTDKSRAAYYNYYTNKTWGMASSYNFSIDVSVLGIDETVEFMKSFIERRLNKRPPHFG